VLELLVVAGLVAVLSFAFLGGLGAEKSVALSSARSTVAGLLAAARARAVAGGTTTRVLVNLGTAGAATPRRFLRYLVMQEQAVGGGGWATVAAVYLPAGVGVLPDAAHQAPGLLADATSWTGANGGALQSSALSALAEPAAVSGFPEDSWSLISFTAAGAPAPAGGAIMLATARPMPPGHDPPVQFLNPHNVRGLILSRYGVPLLVDDSGEF
jgi:hypothetical protein